MMALPDLILIGWLSASLVPAGWGASAPERPRHQVQHGPCSYTFLLPELEECRAPAAAAGLSAPDFQVTNSLQRDAPPPPAGGAQPTWPSQRLQQLEDIMENNTQWLQKLENYIQDSVKIEMAEIQLTSVQNQTAAMLELGSNLLSQTAEQTRKLTDVETQVLNQTSRLQLQLLEHSESTDKLEKQLLTQTEEIGKLQDKNSFLEKKVLEIAGRHEEELQVIKAEKLHTQEELSKQSQLIGELGQQLGTAMLNNTLLQKQQSALMETVNRLMDLVSQCNQIPMVSKDEQKDFKDCSEVYRSGVTTSGVYTLRFPNSSTTVKALCDMETSGGGWTIIQHRTDGTVDFHRTWKEYKQGFGSPPGEYWLGNEFIHQLTAHSAYTLRIKLRDWDQNEAYSLYDHFSLGSEEQNYRLHIRGYSGTAGRASSFSPTGTDFSTQDADHDRCSCKCALMATGGWWFDACGPSNLNGVYYTSSLTPVKYNGMKWHYWKGPSHGLKSSIMMIRPAGI
ncbi:angiopoietin-2-like [Ambystoma mexicanum]|uniref:angiopoietin-2-like n=1 Tax=Ambystoma mexicanum TaxID=8296 RepID=UPI0037E95271